MLSVMEDKPACVALLISRKAALDVRNDGGLTSLMLACHNGGIDIIKANQPTTS